jgi:PDZ domain-containing protein
VTKRLSPLRLALAGLGLLILTTLILWQIRSGSFLLLPDPAQPVAPLVKVQGGHDPKGPGGIYYVAVLEKRASVLEELIPSLHQGASLVPAAQVVPTGTSDAVARQIDLRMMRLSQQVAAAVALRQLGYNVVARPAGVMVDAAVPGTDAVKKLEPTDVIVSIAGARIRTLIDLRRELTRHKVGQVVSVGIRRGDKLTTAKIRLTRLPDKPPRPGLGIFPEQAMDVKLPIRVTIDAGNVGGPSAGLAFALDVMEELGHRVSRGYRVVATGALAANGQVIPIGGVKQKTYGAREGKADVFLVPAGDNARIARLYANGLRVVPVHTFQQALRALATLPRKR